MKKLPSKAEDCVKRRKRFTIHDSILFCNEISRYVDLLLNVIV